MNKFSLPRSSYQQTIEEVLGVDLPFAHSPKKHSIRPKLLLLFLIYSVTMFVIFYFLISLSWNYFSEVFEHANGFFAYLVFILKIIFAYIIYVLLFTYVGSFVCSILSQKIFDELNSVRKRKYKYKLKKFSFFSTMVFIIFSLLKTLIVNILVIPVYFFVPVANVVAFVAINAYFVSREYPGVFLVKYHDKDFMKYYYTLKTKELYSMGAVTSVLCGVPIVGFFVPFISSVMFAKMVLDYKA